MKPRLIFLVGPTAVGKSRAAVTLAKKIDAQIVSCDSMQVYKGMDIITSKPSQSLRRKVAHHLIGVVLPTREYNVSEYRKAAHKKVEEIIKKQKTPLFVGGTGLYMSVLIDGIFKVKAENKSLRRSLYKEAGLKGSKYLHKRLAIIDPDAAAKIHPHDTKRIIRALEVFSCTNKPISQLQKQRKGLSEKYDVKIFCLNMPRSSLYQRIEERVNMMFSDGLVSEAKRLLKLRLSKTASCAIGIRELEGYFDGLYDLEEAKRLIKRSTRQYAKRQLTWFRKDKRIEWINIEDKEKPEQIVERIMQYLAEGLG